jgi:DNA-binding CsgD family transcriptional regulator
MSVLSRQDSAEGVVLSDIRQIRDWRASTTTSVVYERLLAAIGTERFGSTVWDSVLSLTAGARRIYLFEATGRENSSLQYFFGEPGLVELFPAYRKWYLRLDPVCDAYRAAPECSDVALLRVRPPDIASPGFRRRFFDAAGIVERVSIIQRGADSWRVMNVARHSCDGCFTDQELSSLIGLAGLVLPMLPLNRKKLSSPLPLTVVQLEERFASRYRSLTARERQVCARAAIGMSVEATALDLGIAKTSVLTYRQRAYQRLGVTSPFELCALVTH